MTAPATKQDLANLAQATKADLANLAQATKADLANLTKALRKEFATKEDLEDFGIRLKKEVFDGIKFLNEQLFHDFQGAYNDKTSLLNDKVYMHDREIAQIKHFLRLR